MGVLEDWGRGQDAFWFSVMDGHGPTGHHVSARVKQRLPVFVADAWARNRDVKAALAQGYRAANQDLKQSNIDILCSGTTCVSCILHGPTLYVANVGDSRAILGKEGPTPGAPWTALALTTDHKPEVESEKQRILAAGGRIAALQEEYGEPCGPLRWAFFCLFGSPFLCRPLLQMPPIPPQGSSSSSLDLLLLLLQGVARNRGSARAGDVAVSGRFFGEPSRCDLRP